MRNDISEQIIYPGNYYKENTNLGIYFVAKREEVTPEKMMNSESDLMNDFLSVDIGNSDDILNFTRKYGPIIDIGWSEFEEIAVRQDPSYHFMKDKYPFKNVYAFPGYQFEYFYHLIVNICELKGDIDRKADNKIFLRNFLLLLFQPYAKCEYEDKYLGVPCDDPLGQFSYLFFQSMQREIGTITMVSFIKAYEAIIEKNLTENVGREESCYQFYNEAPIINKDTGEKWNILFSRELLAYGLMKEYDELLLVLKELVKTQIFDYLDGSVEDIKKNVKNPDYQIYERVRKLSRILIQDIVNTYSSSQMVRVTDNSEYEMKRNTNYLVQIIFDALSVTLVDYEVRLCRFRKCNNRFIALKGKRKDFCCKACADKEGKYKKRNGEI